MTLKVVVEPGEQSGFVVNVPALPGCWSQGKTREDALANAREAAEAWIEAQQDKMGLISPPMVVDVISL